MLDTWDDRRHVGMAVPERDGFAIEGVADVQQGRGKARVSCGFCDQPVVLQHVGDRRLDLEVVVDQLGDLASGHAAGHRPGIAHSLESAHVQAVPVGEVYRLGQTGDHGDQKYVDREFHEQRVRDRAAGGRLGAHRPEQRANIVHCRVGAGQHADELTRLGGFA